MEISANKKDAIENVDNYDVTNAVLGDNQRGTRFPPSPSNQEKILVHCCYLSTSLGPLKDGVNLKI